MTAYPFNLKPVHSSWRKPLLDALATLDPHYLKSLEQNPNWLPGPEKIFNAFSLPLSQVKYVLFGESPYPRAISANGYAFWDAAVEELWSESGLSKRVNRATSLRNMIKMLLVAEGALKPDQLTQGHIAALNKQAYVQTGREFFNNFLNNGFLLLNASPVLQLTSPDKDAKAWLPFTNKILDYLIIERPRVKLILLGRIANTINKILHRGVEKLYAEHPYNLSFITNQEIIQFFKPLHLLKVKPS